MSLTHALKWSFFSELASRAVQPLVFLILARLLTPEDYGVTGAAAIVISFSTAFWEAGMGKAVIQFSGDTAKAANAAFWINLTLGVGVACLLVLFSGPLSEHLFNDPRVSTVLKVMSLQIVLSASACVHSALLQKDMRFKRLFLVRLLTVAAPGLVSIPLAINGFGYWALIAGTLAGQLLQVGILWYASAWRPTFRGIDWPIARRLMRFGGWVGLTSLLFWFYNWADSLVVGMYLGSRELGLFRSGNTFIMLVFGSLFAPLIPVLYSHFSEIQKDRDRIQSQLLKAMRMVAFISIPLAILIYLNAGFIGGIVFGDAWVGVGRVISIMALVHGLSWIISTDGEAYRAIGMPGTETKIALITLGFYCVGYYLSIRHGLEPFLWTRFGLAVGATALHLWFAKKTLGLPLLKFLGYMARSLSATIPMVLVFCLIPAPQGTLGHIGWAVASTLLLGGALWAVEKKGLIPELRARFLKTAR